MIKHYCDNCGKELFAESSRYIWFKKAYFDSNDSYKLDLCESCYVKFIKHIRRTVQMYKKAGDYDR
jgi:hypothetical protein